MSNIKKMLGNVWTALRLGWSRPPKGKQVSYKEMAAYSVGGMGVNFIVPLIGYITLTAGSTLVGSVYGISPVNLQIMNIVSGLFQGFVVTPIRGWILDNTRSKAGKFRPYIFTMGIPSIALAILLVFLPVDRMSMLSKTLAVFIIYNLIQIFYNFYLGSYNNLVQVISSNTEERSTIISVSSVVFSMAPTITGFVIPLIANTQDGGLTNISTYRIIVPLFAVLGVALGYFAYFGTKEKLVVAKKYVPKVRFMEGLEKMAKNKYFWLINTSAWIGFLKGAVSVIFTWMFVYGTQDMVAYSFLTTLLGTASLFPMLLAPLFIKWFGKKNLVIGSNMISAAACLLLLLCFSNQYLTFICLYINAFAGAFLLITGPAMWAETRDYQQYMTGDRLEGFEGTLGSIVGTGITALTGLILPAMYEYLGLVDNYDILYNNNIRTAIFYWSAIMAVIGAILTALPYFLFDLSEKRHWNIIKVLKVRALFEDYQNGDLTDDRLVDTIEAITEAHDIAVQEKTVITKEGVKAAKALPKGTKEERAERAAAIKAAIKKRHEDKAYNDNIDAAIMVVKELHKFETEELQDAVAEAQALVAAGPQGLADLDAKLKAYDIAKSITADTKEEIKAKHIAVKKAKKAVKRAKLVRRMYPDGITEPDYALAQKAFELPDETKEQRKARKKEIKAAEKIIGKFKKAAKPYIAAQKLIAQETAYNMYPELEAMYPEAKERFVEKERVEAEERARLEQERRDDIERMKRERFEKLSPEKQAKIIAKREAKRKKAAEKETKDSDSGETL